MPTKDFGPAFFTTIATHPKWWRGRILPTRTRSRETEPPWRVGHGLAVRVGKGTALVIGWWGRPRIPDEFSETDLLLEALGGAELEGNEMIREWLGPSAFDLY